MRAAATAGHHGPSFVNQIAGTSKPSLLYGTAWKKEQTPRLVQEAIESGFRFIDTACQPKHYNEAGVGQGWVAASKKLGLKRQDLFLQTKFTSIDGQDPKNIPYDKTAPLEDQVSQSVQKSLENLQTTYLDRVVLHSPMNTLEDTMRVWRVLEGYVEQGVVHSLGVSNCYNFHLFQSIYQQAKIKPSALQNRFYAESGFDVDLRAFCKEHNIWYQSFWTLTANRQALATEQARNLALQKNLSPQTLMYAYMMTMGYTPLDGTTDKQHMAEDVEVMRRIQSGEIILNELELDDMSTLLGVHNMD